ncbi:MAG: RNA-splicing ligase RtcB [Candidatus Hydrogenedentota bacterium]
MVTMKTRELANLGVPRGEPMRYAKDALAAAADSGFGKQDMRVVVRALLENPAAYTADPIWGLFAKAMLADTRERRGFVPRLHPAPYRKWGRDLDPSSIQQMENACALPVSVQGALMPDAHVGYGLPIGGVLATDNAVIPYAVGVDIACRMKLTVLDLPVDALRRMRDQLANAIERETRFGIGASFKERRSHEVMDENWSVSPVTKELKDKAWSQLGTSGSGNHFVEFGVLTVTGEGLGLETGTYLALLSHSGSRGAGASVADYYSKLAMTLHRELPKELSHLAWLDLDTHEGQEYWAAMELMGKYAAANHACIHRHVAKHLGVNVLLDIENHHNFAWKERHAGKEVIVHRKGATPAGAGVIGVIPGSMAAPGFVVRGKGNALSLNSAAHGAGRQMSRKKAIESFRWPQVKKLLEERGVTLLSAGLDEVPAAYKDIETVMAAQSDLVEVLARFDPKLVKMAPAGERPED